MRGLSSYNSGAFGETKSVWLELQKSGILYQMFTKFLRSSKQGCVLTNWRSVLFYNIIAWLVLFIL